MEQGEFPRDILRKMGSLGLMGIPVPEEYGGAGMDFTSYVIAIHEFSKVSAAVGVILAVHTSVGTNPILYFWYGGAKAEICAALSNWAAAGCICFNGAERGLGCRKLKKTHAIKKGDHYLINGSKAFITNGGRGGYVYRIRLYESVGWLAGDLGFHRREGSTRAYYR
ncbi:hypothetical protein GCM10020331_022690 [Ectobacillus funiculus]